MSSEQRYSIGSFKRGGCLRMFYITAYFNTHWNGEKDIKIIVDSP